MRRVLTILLTLTACMLLTTAGLATASTITEVDSGAGNTPGTAQLIPGSAFTLPLPATVFPSAGPTATITGGLQTNSDVDFYAFMLLSDSVMMFDIDNDPFTFDTILSLFDGAGTLIGYDDDSFPADIGSEVGYDSFLGQILLGPGTYYIAVSQFGNFANGEGTNTLLVRPDGEFGGRSVAGAAVGDSTFTVNALETAAGGQGYALHVSAGAATETPVPEPASLTLLGLGLAGMGARRWRKRKAS